jgi:hypothetical protein
MVDPSYLVDASGFTGYADRVIIPETESQVLEALAQAVASRTPITIAGAGTGLTGSRVPLGGWILSLEKFRKLELSPGFARVGPAVTLLELRDAAARTRQFFPPTPPRSPPPLAASLLPTPAAPAASVSAALVATSAPSALPSSTAPSASIAEANLSTSKSRNSPSPPRPSTQLATASDPTWTGLIYSAAPKALSA